MRQRNYKLGGDVQIDDAYLGGEKPGKTGRGVGNKVPFVLAVAPRDGKPLYTHVRRVKAFTKEAIRDYATANIRPGSIVVSDGLACFKRLCKAWRRQAARHLIDAAEMKLAPDAKVVRSSAPNPPSVPPIVGDIVR